MPPEDGKFDGNNEHRRPAVTVCIVHDVYFQYHEHLCYLLRLLDAVYFSRTGVSILVKSCES